jgi:small-conductance mechanosensitive channel
MLLIDIRMRFHPGSALSLFARFGSVFAASVLIVFCHLVLAAPVAAQERGRSIDSLDEIKPALEQAFKDGATIIITGGNSGSAELPEPVTPVSLMDTLRETLARFKATVNTAAAASGNMRQTLAEASPDGTLNWLIYSIVVSLSGLLFGFFISRPVKKWFENLPSGQVFPDSPDRMQRVSFLLFRLLINLTVAVLVGFTGMLVVAAVSGEHRPSFLIGVIIVSTFSVFLIARALFLNLLVPHRTAYRPINMDDSNANGLFRLLMFIFIFAGSVLAVCIWMDLAGIDRDTHKLTLMASSLLAALLFSAAAMIYRKPVAQAILGFDGWTSNPVWLRLLSKAWHVLAIAYFLGAWAVSTSRLLLDKPNAAGLVVGPLLILACGSVLYGLGLLIINRLAARRPHHDDLAIDAGPEELSGISHGNEISSTNEAARPKVPSFKILFEHTLALLLWVIGLSVLVRLWGGSLIAGTGWLSEVIFAGAVIFAAYLAYRAVEIWVQRQAGEELDPTTAALTGAGHPGGAGASRLATLLPIFKNFLLITIVVIAAMLILLELGVNITPLFAGAGVVGLAVGFGAQTLIKDIFSGAFFLIDDAFRKGEYIDIGTVKGTVEKISIRSMQLRHHNGPLNTIPFGEIRQLTNYSRDWVMMKLPLRLTYDTDVEKVRKLIKKLGQELLEHPEIGHKFLQPLKSQGVIQMEDSAMIVRVKFMTKPGDQFDIRKIVYQRIRELFEENDIKFASREVTVRIADDEEHHLSSDDRRKAALGAARAVLDEPNLEK